MKGFSLVCGVAMGISVAAADPPVKKALPTTVEEFAALAKASPLPPWQPFREQPQRVVLSHIDATVVKVTADGLLVLPKGAEKAVTYPAHELLRSGAVCHWETDANCYLLDDVKREDVVILGVGTADKEKGEECFTIMLYWRPGGEVPPSRKPSKLNPYHKRQQTRVEHEERGEYPPEEQLARREAEEFLAKRGLPPPPPLPEKKKLVKAKLPPEEKDEAKK